MVSENLFVSFVCSSCRQEVEASQDMLGQIVECPSCGARIKVEQQETATQAQLDAMKSRTIRIELGDI